MSDETPTPKPLEHPTMPGPGWAVDESAPDVLLFNRRHGFRVLPYNEPAEPTRTEREPYRVHRLTLAPGLNFASGGLWDKLKTHNAQVRLLVSRGDVLELGKVSAFHKQHEDLRIDQISRSADYDTLKRLSDSHSPAKSGEDDVADAFAEALEELEAKNAAQERRRREQRRARRHARR